MNYDDSFLRMWIVIGMIHAERGEREKRWEIRSRLFEIIYPITNEEEGRVTVPTVQCLYWRRFIELVIKISRLLPPEAQ